MIADKIIKIIREKQKRLLNPTTVSLLDSIIDDIKALNCRIGDTVFWLDGHTIISDYIEFEGEESFLTHEGKELSFYGSDWWNHKEDIPEEYQEYEII